MMKKICALVLLLSLLLLASVACDDGSREIEIGGEIIFRDEGVRGDGTDNFGGGGGLFPSDGVDLPPIRPGN